MTTYKFLRWVHSMRWMDERVVTLEKCWNGIKEKMLDREVNYMIWLRIGDISTILGGNFGKLRRRVGKLGKVTRSERRDERGIRKRTS